MISNVAILVWATKPTKQLIGAITNVAGEKSDIAPPNPNALDEEDTGLSDAIRTIYQLARSENPAKPEPKENPQNDMLCRALNKSRVGFVAMDNKQKVIYANTAAPVSIQPDNSLVLDLIFTDDSITKWITECQDNKLNAEHTWVRIPNRFPGDEDRKFFDVIATYQKDGNPETVISTIDRTLDYA
ncbi:MAG: hypothetical protein ACM3KH_00855, partial [Thiobacillus sp.]